MDALSVMELVVAGGGNSTKHNLQVKGANNKSSGFRYSSELTRGMLVLNNNSNTFRLWIDNSGNLRILNADPSSQDDGSVVGSQS